MSLRFDTMHLPLAAGMNQKADPRALQAPELAVCIDAQFDELGGLQTRYPYASLSASILGGGTLSDPRRVVENGGELLVFTKTGLYSWNAQVSKWVLKGAHLAVKVEEEPVFVNNAEQTECDRAELDGTIVYVWKQAIGGTSQGYVAAVDKTTGAVMMAPRTLPGSAARLRVTALETKILLSFYDGIGGLYAYALDPASPATALGGSSTTLTNSNFGEYYDITKVIGEDQAVFACRRNPDTSYLVGTVTAGLTVATSTKARTCTDAIAVSSTPDGASVQIIRTDDGGGGGGSSGDVVGDLITIATLADVYTAQAIGTGSNPIRQVTGAHRSADDGGEYRCYVFWQGTQGNKTPTKYNWVDTGGTLGTQGVFVYATGLGSRAFDHEGRVYVNLAFAGESAVTTSYLDYQFDRAALQNSYFLYRDDEFLVAKQAMFRAGGHSQSIGHLPGVAVDEDDETTYHWCGTERRIVPINKLQSSYADRGPRDIALTFDSNEARRCVRLGQTLYISGGEILQYDGVQLVEVGFHYSPYAYTLTSGNSTPGLATGVYFYKPTARWQNSRGEVDRSTTGAAGGIEITAGPDVVSVAGITNINITHKDDVSLEVWRTLMNPSEDADYYLVSGADPSDVSGDNCFLVNDIDADDIDFADSLPDADIRDLGASPENGGFLEHLAPPAASIIVATDERIFLGGVAGDPDRVWYSKKRSPDELAAFNDALAVGVPAEGGAMTALAILNETLVVFRETSVHVIPGDGLDNTGGGLNYGPARAVSTDVGAVNHESVAVTDKGLVFKSSKGWYLLTKGWSLEYIGGPVADYDELVPLAVQVLEKQHQIRILVAVPTLDVEFEVEDPGDLEASPISRLLVLDTLVGQWGEWTVNDAIHACMWNGTHVYLAEDTAKQQQATYTGVDYGMDIETAWIKLANLQGFGRVRSFEVLGEYLSAHTLRIRVARDYWKDGVDTYFQDKTWTPDPATVGGPLQLKHGPSIQQMQAIKIRITVEGTETIVPAVRASANYSSDSLSLTAQAKTAGADANGWTVEVVTEHGGGGVWEDGTAAVFRAEAFGGTTHTQLVAAAADSEYFNISSVYSFHPIGEPELLTLSGGADETTVETPPAGASLKLTGLSLELGFKRGLHTQLPAAQKQ